MIGCKTPGSRNVLETKNLQWERCSYPDGTGYLSVRSSRDNKEIKFYTFNDAAGTIFDIMIGNENELLGICFNSVESFVFLKGGEVKHTTLCNFSKGWFIHKLIGRVGATIWVYGTYSEKDNETTKSGENDYLVSIESGKMGSIISLSDLIGENIERIVLYAANDSCDNIPHFILIGNSNMMPRAKFYLCYFIPCKNRWFAREISDIRGTIPMLKIGNKLISLGNKDISIDLECEQSSTGPIYSRRNYFWPLSNNKYVYLFKHKEGEKSDNKWQTDLMLYDAEKDERIQIAKIPNGYWRVGLMNDSTLVIRGYDQTLVKDLTYDLKELTESSQMK